MTRPPFVIGVAGPPGSGKSHLCEALVQRLPDAVLLPMDDYQRMTSLPIEAIERWLVQGADHDLLPVPMLADHLAALKRGESVVDPATRRVRRPAAYIVFETHFGRAHAGTGPFIDRLVWLDTPLDIALLRNVRGFLRPLLATNAAPADPRETLRWIDQYLVHYERLVGRLLRLQAERVRPAADLVLPPGDVAQSVAAVLACLPTRD